MNKAYLVTRLSLLVGTLTVYGDHSLKHKLNMDKPKRKVALTFDDAPFPSTKFFNTTDRTAEILKQLNKVKCPPVGVFTVGKHIQNFGANEIQSYDAAGHIICNHSLFSSELIKNIDRGFCCRY